MANGDLLTSDEAGQIIGKSTRTVNRLAESGKLPVAHKLPGTRGAYLFRRVDVERMAKRLAEAS